MPSSRSKIKPVANQRWVFEAIGTQWTIDITAPAGRLDSLKQHITKRITAFDMTYSRFRPDSLVTTMAKRAGEHRLPDDAKPLFALYQHMYMATEGAVTPLIGQALVDAGYDATYSLQPKTLHQPPAWDDVIDYTAPTLRLAKPALLDFGAAGKGYLVDIVSELLAEQGVRQYCVDAGGDMRQCSDTATDDDSSILRVGLENPHDPTQVIGLAEPHNQSLCGSAGNRRAWAGFTHIIDPHSLQSPQDIVATWAVADTTLLADGMATCLFFTPPELLQRSFAFEYVVVYSNGSAHISPGFPGKLF